MGQEAVVKFLCCGAEGWAICVRDKVVDGEIEASWLQPVQQGLHVHVPLRRLDSAEECVLKDPLELPRRWIPQKSIWWNSARKPTVAVASRPDG